MNNHTVLEADDHQGPKARGMPSQESVAERIGVEEPEESPQRTVNAPYGMYWQNDALVPFTWFVELVAKGANEALGAAREDAEQEVRRKDDCTRVIVKEMGEQLRQYVAERSALNDMAGARILKHEMSDAGWQLAQAAKFAIDAQQKAQWLHENARSEEIADNQQINTLRERALMGAREGYIIASACMLAGSLGDDLDLRGAAKRVCEYSARRLTEWYGARQSREAERLALEKLTSAMDLSNIFRRRPR